MHKGLRRPLLCLLAFGLGLPSEASSASRCLTVSTATAFQAPNSCDDALCCPRPLQLQLNVVRAVAAKLRIQGYKIVADGTPDSGSPAVTGYYDPSTPSVLKNAIQQYKADSKMIPFNGDITYPFVQSVLGADLLSRWRINTR